MDSLCHFHVSHRLLGSASVPLNNLVRSKNNSMETEVDLLDGENNATPVSSLSYVGIFGPFCICLDYWLEFFSNPNNETFFQLAFVVSFSHFMTNENL